MIGGGGTAETANGENAPAAGSEGSPLKRQESTGAHRLLYTTLELAPGATEDEIKRAYRRMALRHHPDKNLNDPSAAEKFKEINYANNVLSNPTKRRIYDEYGTAGLKMMETIGEDTFAMYLMESKWFKWAFLCCGIFSGCYCCCCCCCLCCFNCCCNHCCGKYAPTREEYANFDDFMEAQQQSRNDYDRVTTTSDTAPIITQQPMNPQSSPQHQNAPQPERPSVIAMPPPQSAVVTEQSTTTTESTTDKDYGSTNQATASPTAAAVSPPTTTAV